MVIKHKVLLCIALGLTMLCFGEAAMAGVTGVEFQPIFTLLEGWVGGYLGRTIAFTGMILGIGAAALSQRPVLGLVGLFFGILILVIPQVLNTMLGAVI